MDDKVTSAQKLGRFIIKDEDENESLGAGSLFAQRKDTDSCSTATSKDANTSRRFLHAQLRTSVTAKKEDSVTTKQSEARSSNASKKGEVNGASSHVSAAKCKGKLKQGLLSKKPKLIGKPFERLLEDVVLVVSGYQNPYRGNLRALALEMGARYKADWDNNCTHLICAFPNTPKFQQVWGKGRIVRKEWIENCHSKRKRLPWRRYALDKRDLSKPESEEEIPELVQDAESISQQSFDNSSQSESDTEDEIEKLRGTKACGGETDMESDTDLPDTSNVPLPQLPNIFSGKHFYLNDDLCIETKSKLRRYIVALGGLLSDIENDKVDIVISERKIESKHSVVRPEWIWECNDAENLLPTKTFRI